MAAAESEGKALTAFGEQAFQVNPEGKPDQEEMLYCSLASGSQELAHPPAEQKTGKKLSRHCPDNFQQESKRGGKEEEEEEYEEKEEEEEAGHIDGDDEEEEEVGTVENEEVDEIEEEERGEQEQENNRTERDAEAILDIGSNHGSGHLNQNLSHQKSSIAGTKASSEAREPCSVDLPVEQGGGRLEAIPKDLDVEVIGSPFGIDPAAGARITNPSAEMEGTSMNSWRPNPHRNMALGSLASPPETQTCHTEFYQGTPAFCPYTEHIKEPLSSMSCTNDPGSDNDIDNAANVWERIMPQALTGNAPISSSGLSDVKEGIEEAKVVVRCKENHVYTTEDVDELHAPMEAKIEGLDSLDLLLTAVQQATSRGVQGQEHNDGHSQLIDSVNHCVYSGVKHVRFLFGTSAIVQKKVLRRAKSAFKNGHVDANSVWRLGVLGAVGHMDVSRRKKMQKASVLESEGKKKRMTVRPTSQRRGGNSSLDELEMSHSKNGKALVLSKRGRSQVLPNRFSDSVIQPWKRVSRRSH